MYQLLRDGQLGCLGILGWPEAKRDVVEEKLKTGCFVYLALVEKKGELSNLIASRWAFERCKDSDPERYRIARVERKRAQTRWSNFSKARRLPYCLEAAYSHSPAAPIDLGLALAAARKRCELLLKQAGKTHEFELLSKLEF